MWLLLISYSILKQCKPHTWRTVPCDAGKSITTVRVSRQIQRLAERLVHIFKLALDVSCKRLRYSVTQRWPKQRGVILYSAASCKNRNHCCHAMFLERLIHPEDSVIVCHVHICSGLLFISDQASLVSMQGSCVNSLRLSPWLGCRLWARFYHPTSLLDLANVSEWKKRPCSHVQSSGGGSETRRVSLLEQQINVHGV